MEKISFQEIDGELFTRLAGQNEWDFRIGGEGPREYALYCGGMCAGLGSAWSNAVHPYRRYISLFTVPTFRRRGLGRRLFAFIRQKEQEAKWQAGVDSDDASAAAFTRALGFCLARRCFLCEAELTRKAEFAEPEGFIDLCAADEQTRSLYQELLYDSYRKKHSHVNRLSDKLDAKALWLKVADGLSQEDSFILSGVDGHALLLCYGEGEGEAEVGYLSSDCDRLSLESFIRASLGRLAQRYDSLCFEADDCDPDALLLAKLVGARLDSSFDSYTFG